MIFTITDKARRTSSSGHSRSRKSNSLRDVQPCTAWFQSVRSDVSDIVPLCNVPTLGSLYSDVQEKRSNKKKIRLVNHYSFVIKLSYYFPI